MTQGILIAVAAVIVVAMAAVFVYRNRKNAAKAEKAAEESNYYPVLLKRKLEKGVWFGCFYRHGVLCNADVYGIPDDCRGAGLRVWALNVGFEERYLMEAKTFGPPRYCCGHEGVVLSYFDKGRGGWLCEYYRNGVSFCGIVFGLSAEDALEGCSVNVVQMPERDVGTFRTLS